MHLLTSIKRDKGQLHSSGRTLHRVGLEPIRQYRPNVFGYGAVKLIPSLYFRRPSPTTFDLVSRTSALVNRVMAVPTIATDLTPEQRLALSYATRGSRARFAGLFALDRLLGKAVAKGREPLAAQLRLAWWRDELATASPAAPDWRIGALLQMWRNDRAPLLALVDGWEELTGEVPDWSACVKGRASPFEALARDLGCSSQDISEAGSAAHLWLLVDLGDHLSDETERTAVRDLARARARPPGRLPPSMRPLTVLAGLAQRALARGGPLFGDRFSPLVAMRLGIFGR